MKGIVDSEDLQLNTSREHNHFVKGVVDSEDLPLNNSREHNHFVFGILFDGSGMVSDLSPTQKQSQTYVFAMQTTTRTPGVLARTVLCVVTPILSRLCTHGFEELSTPGYSRGATRVCVEPHPGLCGINLHKGKALTMTDNSNMHGIPSASCSVVVHALVVMIVAAISRMTEEGREAAHDFTFVTGAWSRLVPPSGVRRMTAASVHPSEGLRLFKGLSCGEALGGNG